MFRHVVLMCWKAGTTDEDVAHARNALLGLPSDISEIRSYVVGLDAGEADGNYNLAIVADFDDEAGYVVYRDHPAHQRVIRDVIRPILHARAAVQHEV
jgi:Stress responsive A/B Barrel Domain